MNTTFKHMAKHTKLALLFFTLLLVPNLSHARDVSFKWTAIPDPLNGYKLYCQVEGSAVDAPIMLGKVTTHTLTGLASDKTYNFYLTAYNSAGESGKSAVVTITPDSSPVILNISIK